MHEVIAGIAELKRGQEAHADKLDELHHRLFGNGQPGELSELKSEFNKQHHLHGERIRTLEKFKWLLSGAGIVFGALGTLVGAIMEMIAKGIK